MAELNRGTFVGEMERLIDEDMFLLFNGYLY